jgi:hypothetical protein
LGFERFMNPVNVGLEQFCKNRILTLTWCLFTRFPGSYWSSSGKNSNRTGKQRPYNPSTTAARGPHRGGLGPLWPTAVWTKNSPVGLVEGLKWLNTCLASVRLWVQSPVPPKKKKPDKTLL